ncbi:YlbL family protein [Microbacterium sp. DT81.1]|uniref:YlbL family protein n=1 Tax=Microbacterium sp. DT81.1 TaxID=3393413 RepID=UPI003CEB617C
MVLIDETVAVVPAPKKRLPRGTIVGLWALTVALVVLLIITFLPTSYVIQRPGPVYNTLGTATAADGTQVPLISVEGAETFETSGSLDLTTVQVVGNRERTPSWFELASAWFDPSKAVVPLASVFPEGQSSDERNEQNATLMVDSQQEATAAALTELGYDVESSVRVVELVEGSPAEGVLEPDDVIVSANGTPVADAETLREIIRAGEGQPVELNIRRGGSDETVTITPESREIDGEDTWIIGVTLIHDYEFPIDVTIQLDNVGGPSAGMMFALGIVDTLTPEELTGGENVAGTGTIDAEGTVGPIGGIRQKLYGARAAGADFFLAPESNCDEVVGHIPNGLRVFATGTLEESMTALDAIADGGDVADLPTCTGAAS